MGVHGIEPYRVTTTQSSLKAMLYTRAPSIKAKLDEGHVGTADSDDGVLDSATQPDYSLPDPPVPRRPASQQLAALAANYDVVPSNTARTFAGFRSSLDTPLHTPLTDFDQMRHRSLNTLRDGSPSADGEDAEDDAASISDSTQSASSLVFTQPNSVAMVDEADFDVPNLLRRPTFSEHGSDHGSTTPPRTPDTASCVVRPPRRRVLGSRGVRGGGKSETQVLVDDEQSFGVTGLRAAPLEPISPDWSPLPQDDAGSATDDAVDDAMSFDASSVPPDIAAAALEAIQAADAAQLAAEKAAQALAVARAHSTQQARRGSTTPPSSTQQARRASLTSTGSVATDSSQLGRSGSMTNTTTSASSQHARRGSHSNVSVPAIQTKRRGSMISSDDDTLDLPQTPQIGRASCRERV